MLYVQELACRRGGRTIFHDAEFYLEAGDALLVTGANGSGKSSLLRVIAGLLPSSCGMVKWAGQDIAKDPEAYRRCLRYVGHLDAVKTGMTVAESLDYWGALAGARSDGAAAEDPFNIAALRDKAGRFLSAGQKRRLTLARLLIGEASLWLLDEPMTALDAAGQDILCACIARHRARGGIAIVATHQEMALPDARRFAMDGGA